MLVHHLNLAIESLQSLIDITKSDIDDIKQAKHEKLFARLKSKEEILSSFEKYKNHIDSEIVSMASKNPNLDLRELLSDAQQTLLEDMREKLTQLRSTNKHYAKLVIAVSSFYNSLLEQMTPKDEQRAGYDGLMQRRTSILEIKA
jgi:glutamyl-tRNA reductase